MDLTKITAQAETIKAQILEDAKDSSDNAEDQKAYIQTIAENGCSGGSCNNLIYYKDTEAFANQYADEIDEMLAEAQENGYSPFESDYYKKNGYNLRNYLAWFAYEVRAQEIMQELEDQAEAGKEEQK